MKIRELLSIDALQPISALTGEQGLDRIMKDVVLLEYDSLQQPRPEDYYLEDFIVSTLYFAKDNPQTLLEVVRQLIELGAVGLAFKSVYYEELPPEVLELAEAEGFPILRFDRLYIEDVILSISDYMRLRQEFSTFEDSIYQVLRENLERRTVEKLCSRMNPVRRKYTNAVFVHSRDLCTDWSGELRSVLQRRGSRSLTADYRFFQFRRGFFVLSSYTEPPSPREIGEQIIKLFQTLGLSTDELCFGVGSLQQRTADFDCVLRDAFDALVYGIRIGHQLTTLEEARLYQCIFPIFRDSSAQATMQRMLNRLLDGEHGYHGSLLETLDTYAAEGYRINDAAKKLIQHPNTVRYRLKRICAMAASPVETDQVLFLMAEYRQMDQIMQKIY